MIRSIIFDLNGVFLQSKLLSDRFQDRFDVLSTEFIAALSGIMSIARKPGLDDSFTLWQPYLAKWHVDLGKDEFFQFWFSGEKVVPELLALTRSLREKDIKVFILSNNFKERTEYYRLNFPEIFQAVDAAYFSWETGFVKPDPKAFSNILTANNLVPTECLFFDDSDKNIAVAKSLGIISERYKSPSHTRDFIEKLIRR